MKLKGSQTVRDGRIDAEIKAYQMQNNLYANVLYNFENQSNDYSLHRKIKFNLLTGFDVVGQNAN